MKKLFYIIAATALLGGLVGCNPQEQEEVQPVDLRYRADDVYELSATRAKAFTILVASTKPWTVTSAHPDWCIISEEEGAASDPELVHVGKAEATAIRVQYYDNTFLDDREDQITIQSEDWIGKVITVRQKGIAFLTVPEEDLSQEVVKAGGDYVIHVQSNQDWSAQVTSGEWLTVSEGATGNSVGTITVTAKENESELRYAEVTVYDRYQVPSALILFTQDGVQLVPLADEIRAGYDQLAAEVELLSNAKWVVVKASDTDDWFNIVTTSGEGDGKIQLTLTQNNGEGMRSSSIIVRNVVSNPGDAAVEKEIIVKQAYKINPVHYAMNADELGNWTSDWANVPVFLKDVGLRFDSKARLNRSMPFGSYTFRWSQIGAGARVRHWFCFNEGCELKFDIRPADAKISFDFNAAGDGNKPSIDAYTAVDFNNPIEITYKFDPSGAEYCHVTYLVNGVEVGSFDTSESMLRTVQWGKSINMYIGVQDADSAVCEWYEYTAPMNWDE